MTAMSPEGRRAIARYADRGWFDAGGDARLDARLRDLGAAPQLPQPAYLVLASGLVVPPLSEVQVTTRGHYRAFRGRQLVVASAATRRFDLIDLSVAQRSQFHRAEALALRSCADEGAPELIQWPLELCRSGGEVVARAIIFARESGAEDDDGAELELILIGEVLLDA